MLHEILEAKGNGFRLGDSPRPCPCP
jgi:hypothetical protein